MPVHLVRRRGYIRLGTGALRRRTLYRRIRTRRRQQRFCSAAPSPFPPPPPPPLPCPPFLHTEQGGEAGPQEWLRSTNHAAGLRRQLEAEVEAVAHAVEGAVPLFQVMRTRCGWRSERLI